MKLIPYILFDGYCEEALKFYEKALGGEIKDLRRFEGSPAENMSADKQKVMHSNFAVEGTILFMASDGGRTSGEQGERMIQLSVSFTDAGKMEQVFAAMGEGGKVGMPLQDTFWGARFGMLTDQYGVSWMFNYENKEPKH